VCLYMFSTRGWLASSVSQPLDPTTSIEPKLTNKLVRDRRGQYRRPTPFTSHRPRLTPWYTSAYGFRGRRLWADVYAAAALSSTNRVLRVLLACMLASMWRVLWFCCQLLASQPPCARVWLDRTNLTPSGC
jgi:hypothetical protein